MTRLIDLRVRLIWPEVAAIQICVLFAAIARGLDYLIPPGPSTNVLSTVEKAAPMGVWGLLFVVGGVVGLVGLKVDRWPLAGIGHVILLACYSSFAVGAMVDVLHHGGFEGWRTPLDWLLVFAVIHWGYTDASLDVWREKRHAS